MDFTNKVVVVTGGARGIGAEVARTFHAHGATVAITDILQTEGEALAAAVGERMRFFAHDVREEAQWDQVLGKVIDWAGGFDVLINNAGVAETQLIVDMDIEAARRMLNVNVLGVMLGMKWSFRAMRPEGRGGRGGAIVNLSSMAAHTSSAGMGPYGSTKAAVERLTKVGAVEGGPQNIRVNCLYPGVIQSDMIDQLVDDVVSTGSFKTDEEARAWLVGRTPLGRLGQASDVAKAALFLASDYAEFISGTGLFVDGAISLTA